MKVYGRSRWHNKMHSKKGNTAFWMSPTYFLCLHWMFFGIILCQEASNKSTENNSQRSKSILETNTFTSIMKTKEPLNQPNVNYNTPSTTIADFSILSAVELIANVLLSPQVTSLSESLQSIPSDTENLNSVSIQSSFLSQSSSSSSSLFSSSKNLSQSSVVSQNASFVPSFSHIKISPNFSSTLFPIQSSYTALTYDKSEEYFQVNSLAGEISTHYSHDSIVLASELLLSKTNNNFISSISSINKQIISPSISVTHNDISSNITPILIEASLDLQHQSNNDFEIISSISQIQSLTSYSPKPTANLKGISSTLQLSNPNKNQKLLLSNSNFHNNNDLEKENGISDDNLVLSSPLKNYTLSFSKTAFDEEISTVFISSIAPDLLAEIKDNSSFMLSSYPVLPSMAQFPSTNLQTISLQTSFLETNNFDAFRSEYLIEITPSLISHRSSKEASLESNAFKDNEEISIKITSHTNMPQPSITHSNIDGDDVFINSNSSTLSNEDEFTHTLKNKTSREDSPQIDDIISGIIHLLAGDVKIVRPPPPPPPQFYLSQNAMPMLRPLKSTSTRINNRGPPTFISPSRTVVLFSQPDHALTLVPRPIHPPTLWNMRHSNIHRLPVIRPIAETNLIHFHSKPGSPTRPEIIPSKTSIVHMYKPLLYPQPIAEHSVEFPHNGDVYLITPKPSNDNRLNNDEKHFGTPHIRISPGGNTFEVFRPSTSNQNVKDSTLNQNSRLPSSSTKLKSPDIVNPKLTSQFPNNSPNEHNEEGVTDWAPLLEQPIKKRPQTESDHEELPNDHGVVIITQPTVFDLTVTNAIAGLQKPNLRPPSLSNLQDDLTSTNISFTNDISSPSKSTVEVFFTGVNSEILTNSSFSLSEHEQIDDQTQISSATFSTSEKLKTPSILLTGSLSSFSATNLLSTPSLESFPSKSPSTVKINYQTTTNFSGRATVSVTGYAIESSKSPLQNMRTPIIIEKTVLPTTKLHIKPPSRPSFTRPSISLSKSKDYSGDRTLLGRPIVVPVDIEEVRPYVGAINPPPRQGPGPPSQNFPHDKRPMSNASNVQIAQAGINVNDNRGSALNSPTRKPSLIRTPPKLKPHPPLVRIDTCIVGDESTCDVKLNETCKTQLGISSCQCRAGFARIFMRGPCQPVVSIMMSLKVDRFGNQKVSYSPRYTDRNTEEYKMMEFEAKQALSSLFSYTAFSRHFLGVSVNKFYAIGGRLIVNATVNLEENNLTRSPAMRLRIRQEVVKAINQKNQNIGDSRLYVDGPLNPVPAVEDVNECSDSNLNDCAEEGYCQNVFGTFQCVCKLGFIDANPFDERQSGRRCSACTPDFCSNHGICYIENSERLCRCSGNYIGSRCDIDSEVLGVAVGASVAAIIIILLTLACLCVWNRRWKREQQRTEAMSARSVNSNQTFSYLNKLANANTYRLTVEDRMRWAHISDVVSNLYAKPDPGINQTLGAGQSGYPDPSRCQSPMDDSLTWYNCATRPRSRALPYAQNPTPGSFYDMDYSTRDIYMGGSSHTSPRRNLNQNIQRTYYS